MRKRVCQCATVCVIRERTLYRSPYTVYSVATPLLDYFVSQLRLLVDLVDLALKEK